MKKEIHPEYRRVAFKDVSCDYTLVTRSTIKTGETITLDDGQQYPLIKVQISSASHPFFTGKEKIMDSAGRVDRFKKKYGEKTVIKKK